MNNSVLRVQTWARDHHPVRVAVLGAGFVGKGLVHRLSKIGGFQPALVVNRSPEEAIAAYRKIGTGREDIVVSDDAGSIREAIYRGRAVVATTPDVIVELDNIDVVFEATGAIGYGAHVVLLALSSGKHVVSMNAELDATIGFLLHSKAAENGVCYTICDGDQPGVILRMLRFVEGMGIEVIAAVNCKRHLNPYQTPADSQQYANRDSNSLLMATAFGDGTKMNIEQSVIANVTGLLPDRRGMHGVETTLDRAARDIVSALERRGAVEYTLGGDFGAGVGVVGFADDPEMEMQALKNYKMGDGPYYFFFRPYHLVHFEAPFTIADAFLDGLPLGAPTGAPCTEVVSLAKQDLKAGTRIDGIGGAACYGQIDTVAGAEGLLPIGFSEHATLLRAAHRDDPVQLSDVEIDEDATIVRLRLEQARLLERAGDQAIATGRPLSQRG